LRTTRRTDDRLAVRLGGVGVGAGYPISGALADAAGLPGAFSFRAAVCAMALGCAVVVVPSAAGSRSASVNGVEDGDDLDAAEDAAGQMAAGLRVRRALDLPLDEYDWVVASALLAARERSS
jgi:hypothetical protein